jgi:hypothetical protein
MWVMIRSGDSRSYNKPSLANVMPLAKSKSRPFREVAVLGGAQYARLGDKRGRDNSPTLLNVRRTRAARAVAGSLFARYLKERQGIAFHLALRA